MSFRKSLVALLFSTAIIVSGCTGSRPTLAPAKSTSPPVSAVATSTTLVPAGWSLVATASIPSVVVYTSPDTTAPKTATLSNPNPSGAPLVFLVDKPQGTWYHVYLPIRPNGSSGWVQAADVTTAPNPYRIVVSASQHQLTLYKDGNTVVNQFTVGIGQDQYPTPGGVFYIKELLKPPNPNGDYGPYAYGLSGFSDVASLANFNGGDGTIGIHGTNDPSSIGKSFSHGCVRMNNKDVTTLAAILPLGTPVEIQA